MKKWLALILALAVVLSLVPSNVVNAEEQVPQVRVGKITAALDAEGVDSVNVFVPVEIVNNIGFSGIQMTFSAPSSFELKSFRIDRDPTVSKPTYSVFYQEDEWGDWQTDATMVSNPNTASITITNPYADIVDDGYLCWLYFSIPKSAINGNYDITVELDTLTSNEDLNNELKDQVTCIPGTITVTGGVEPVATTVEVTPETQTVAVPTKAAVDDGNPTKAQMSAVVKNQIGAAMSGQKVTWSVVGNPAGVSVDETGLVTVDNTAAAGTVTVQASCNGKTDTATLTLTKDNLAATTLVADNKSISVPTLVQSTETVELTATVYDQYGAPMNGQTVTWAIVGTAPTGVSLSGNTLSITNETQDGSVKVTATCGSLTDDATVTISKAPAVPTTVTIYKGEAEVTADSITIPQTGSTTVPYSAVVTDQYGATMPNHVASWTLTPAGKGLSVNANNGDVTAEANAEPGTYTLTATCGSASATMTITAAQIQFAVGDDAITVAENPTYGATWGQIVSVDNSKITATVGGEPVTGTYSVKDADQRPDAGAQTYTIVFNGSGYTNVAVTTGTVEIAPKTVTLSITGETTVSYGTDYSHAASYDAVAGDEVDATITYLNSTGEAIAKPANAGSYQVKATINDANYFATPVTKNFTITKVTLGDGVYLTKNINLVKDCSSPQTGKVTLADLFGDQIPDGAAIQSVTPGSGNLIDTIISHTDYVEYTSETDLGDGANEIYTIKISFTNFVDIDVALSFTPVDKFDVSDQITFPNGTAVYNGAEQTYEKATCTLDEGEITYSYSPAAVKNAGTYTVTATYEDDFNMGSKTATFTITKKPVTVSNGSAAVTKTYNGTANAGTLSGSFAVNGICSQDVTTGGYVTAGTIPAYSNANVHSENISVPVTLKDNFATNYSLSSSAVSVPATIIAKAITPTVENIAPVTYDGEAQEPAVTVKDGETALTTNDYTVKYENNVNAGTATAIITAKAGGNYTFDQVTKNFTINKADFGTVPSKVVNIVRNRAEAQTGSLAAADLVANAPAGATVKSVSGTGAIMAEVKVENGKVAYTSKTNLDDTAAAASYTVTIESTNYNDFTVTLTFQPVDKEDAQLTLTAPKSKTYGDGAFQLSAAVANPGANGKYTWSVTNGSVTGNGSKATASIANAGTMAVTVTYESDTTMATATANITIEKATVTVRALDRQVRVGMSVPTLGNILGKDYTVEGLGYGDKLGGTVTLSYAKTPNTSSTGRYEIVPAGGTVPNTTNYNPAIVYESGYLTVVSNEKPQVTVTGGAHGFATISDPDAKEGDVVTIQVTCDPGYEVDEVTVTTLSGKSVRVVKTGGKYTFVMPEEKVKIQVTYQEIQEVAYTDVVVGSWYEEAVAYVSDNGIMNGVGGGKFAPNRAVTRAMVWTVLARMDGEDTASTGLWYAKAQQWAMETGVSDGTNPESAITREQLATMLYRYYGSPAISGSLSGYADGASVSDWAKDAMVWAVQEGLIQGTGGNKLSPTADTTRAQLAQILMRLDLKF